MQIVCGLSGAGVKLDCMCADGPSALRALEEFHSDLLVTETSLPGMDGQALARHALCSFRLPVRPGVLILFDGRCAPPEQEALSACGAEFLETPFSPEAFVAAADRLRKRKLRFTVREQRHADSLLDALGIPDHPGRDCLKLASLLCAADRSLGQNLSAGLYPRTGAAFGINARQAERAIRHAIFLAWRSDKFDNQYRIFADTVDAGRGQPTCGEMISRLADILRSEG